MTFRLIFWIFLAAALVGCTGQVAEPTRIDKGDSNAVTGALTEQIEREMKSKEIAGLSVALIDDQRVVWARGFGWADVEARRPATPDTLYQMCIRDSN